MTRDKRTGFNMGTGVRRSDEARGRRGRFCREGSLVREEVFETPRTNELSDSEDDRKVRQVSPLRRTDCRLVGNRVGPEKGRDVGVGCDEREIP